MQLLFDVPTSVDREYRRRWTTIVLHGVLTLVFVILGALPTGDLLATSPEPGFQPVPRFDRLGVEDGLSHTTVWASLQDADGFMWFATEEGLSRFDGYEFVTYPHDSRRPDALSASGIMTLAQDRQGRLWIGTYGGGVNLFNPRRNNFRHFRHRPDDPDSLSHDVVLAMLEDDTGDMWFGTRAGLTRLDGSTLQTRRVPLAADGQEEPRILALFQDSRGRRWAGTDCGLRSFDPAGPTSPCIQPVIDGVRRATSVYALAEDTRGRLWTGTSQGLRYVEATAETPPRLRRPPSDPPWNGDPIQSLFVDRDGILWIGYSTEGLTRFDPATGNRTTYVRDAADVRSLSDDSIIHIGQDATGILWFSTYLGVNRLDPTGLQFPTYRHQPGHADTLNSNSIWAIHEGTSGDLWIGTYNEGLNHVDGDRRRVTHHTPNADDPDALTSGAINALELAADGTLWVGTWDGLSRRQAEESAFRTLRHRPDDPSSLSHNIVQYLYEDSRQRLWIGTFQGLNRLHEDGRTVRRFDQPGGVPATTSITAIVEADDGSIWFGSSASGLFQWQGDEQAFGRLLHRPGDPNSLGSNKIASLYMDPDGILWIGTYGSGLDRYDPEDGGFRHYREEDGLPNNTVLGILQDDDGDLWVSTFSGLGRLDPIAGKTQRYNRTHGLQGDTFSDGSYFKSRRGELLFGGTDGLNIIDPSRLSRTIDPPIVRLTDFRLLKESAAEPETPWREQFLDGTVVLQHDQDLFSIDFAALHYSNPNGHRYSYHLQGFDDTWVHTDARKRFAQYSNLDAGNYRFEVRAQTADGISSERAAHLNIVVLPAPWHTWWAYLLYALALAAAFSTFLVLQRRKIERERAINRQLREVDRLKNDFLANTSHELRTPLHGMTGIAESLLEGAAGPLSQSLRRNLTLIIGSGRRLSALVDDLLDYSKLGRGHLALDKKPVDLATLCDTVISLSRSLVGDKPLTLRNDVPVTLPPALADAHRLQQVLHNLVANALKFTEQGTVIVDAEAIDDSLVVRIRDTGIGIDADRWQEIFKPFVQVDGAVDRRHGGAGLGLSVAQEIIRLHGGDIWLDHNTPRGMVFSFSLPQAAMGEAEMLIERPAAPTVAAPQDALPKVPPAPTGQTADVQTADVQAADVQAADAQTVAPETVSVPPSMTLLPPTGTPQAVSTAAAPNTPLSGQPLAPEKFHLLIVDDEPVNRQVLVNILSTLGYRLSEASSGKEAIHQLSTADVDLVLLDIMMPEMSGYEVCRTLRRSRSMQELPVIFLTAKSQDEDLVSGFAAGGNDFLTKPVRRLELISRVRSHLELVYLHRHLEGLVTARTQRIGELNQELEARNAELEQFTYTVSHDLKSPLVTIKGFLGFARKDALSGNVDRIHKDFDRIAMATDKMDRLLESLIDLSRIGHLAEERTTFDSRELVQEVAESLSRWRRDCGATLHIEADMPQIWGNRQRIFEVFKSLLENSLQFLGETAQPHIHVGVDGGDDSPLFFVRDNGIGIPKVYLEKIFGLFERLEPTGDGTGSGLTLARRIVETHGGTLWAESDGEGQGATFYFTLPSKPPLTAPSKQTLPPAGV